VHHIALCVGCNSVLCLRVLQAALVYVNTLMVQNVLVDDASSDRLAAADQRGLNPLFWTHVAIRRGPPQHGTPTRTPTRLTPHRVGSRKGIGY
jgi:hypothetical protein